MQAIIIYGTSTGSTELLAGYISDGIKQAGIDVVIRNVIDTDVDDMQDYDIIFLGSSTWGEGDLQDDFIEFYDAMAGLDLSGKKGAAFGPGDSSYDMFCEAVNLLEERLKDCGAAIIAPGRRRDGDVVEAEEAAIEWGRQAATALV